jgi:hypothetical protein
MAYSLSCVVVICELLVSTPSMFREKHTQSHMALFRDLTYTLLKYINTHPRDFNAIVGLILTSKGNDD